MGLVPEEPVPPDEIAGQRELLSRLRAAVEAKDAENAVLRRPPAECRQCKAALDGAQAAGSRWAHNCASRLVARQRSARSYSAARAAS